MKTIQLFGLAIKGNDFDYKKISEKGLQCGYIVDKECSTKEVYDYLCKQDINTNTTFYKTWEDIISKNRFELLVDQIIHYMSTYGTNHEGKPYIPNENHKEKPVVDFKEFKKIRSASKEDILEKCDGLLQSGIALNQETLDDIFSIYNKFYYLPDIDKIKNKEALMKICEQKNILPTDPVEFVRFLVYLATGKTLLIKDKRTIETIKENPIDVSGYIEKFGEDKLSQVFYRFKPILLAFRTTKENKKKINRVRRLAVKNHKPYKKTFWEDVLSNPDKIDQIPEKIGELNIFKKISLLETVMNSNTGDYKKYQIRNGKYWIKEKVKRKHPLLQSIFYKSLVEDLSKHKGKTFYIPEHLDIKLPRSGKTFIGNLPIGTEIKLPKSDLVIGINRRGEDGAEDFDLSFLDMQGNKIGWDSRYYNGKKSIIYSGDMTSANPEATELLYFNNISEEGMVNINRFSGEQGSKYTLFIAKEDCSNVDKGYMVKKENILFQTELVSDKAENIIGIKTKDSFVLQNVVSGNKQVSEGTTITQAYLDIVLNEKKVSFKRLLLDIGMVEKKGKPDYDFSNPQKDDIISFLNVQKKG